MSLAVFDLDGVLADVRHRLHHLEGRPKNWRAFFREAVHDPVLDEGRRALQQAVADGNRIVYLTGRPDWCRLDTRTWFAANDLPDTELHMRPARDRRPARFYKADVLSQLAQSTTVHVMYDDDAAVVEHLSALGLPVVHATWMTVAGPAEAEDMRTLYWAQEEEGRT